MTKPVPGARMGRPAIERDEKLASQVKTLVGMGTPLIDVAKFIGISRPTMQVLYLREIETGHIEANANVAKSLYKLACGTATVKPNVIACIFWAKTRMGWREDGDDQGKKEAAEALGRAAAKGTGWAGLLADEPEAETS